LEYLRTLSLKFQKAWTKIEVVLSLPCWLSQFSFYLDTKLGETPSLHTLVKCGFVEFILQDPTFFSLFFALLFLVCKGKKGPGSPGTFKKSPGTFGLL
jgi:hypothetical protein